MASGTDPPSIIVRPCHTHKSGAENKPCFFLGLPFLGLFFWWFSKPNRSMKTVEGTCLTDYGYPSLIM